MNYRGRAKKRKIYKANLIAALGLLLLIALSVAGVTHAWFISSLQSTSNTFEAGTVLISEPVLQSRSANDDPACWEITNTGTKNVFIRVRLEGKSVRYDSAWSRDTDLFRAGPPPAAKPLYIMAHFKHQKNSTTTVPFIVNPIFPKEVGEVTISSTEDDLTISVNITGESGGLMYGELKYNTTKELEPHSNITQLGQWEKIPLYSNGQNNFEHIIATDSEFYNQNDEIYIALHNGNFIDHTELLGDNLGDYGELFWSLTANSSSTWQWVEKESEAYDWYYYLGIVEAGDTVRVCFEAPEAEYKNVRLIAEAVQASHEAVFTQWGMGYLPLPINEWHRVNYDNNQWHIIRNGNTYVWQILNQDGDKGWVLFE